MTDSVSQASETATPLKDMAVDLIHSLQAAAPQVTEAVVKYTWAQGVTGVAVAGLMVLLSVGILIFSRWCFRKEKEVEATNRYNTNGWAFLGLVMIFFAVLSFGGAITSFTKSLPTMLAPEGAAVINVLEAARGAVTR